MSFPPPQSGRDVEELGAGDAEQEDRRTAREVGDVLDEVDEHRLRPLQVVHDDDLRALERPLLEEPAERDACLLPVSTRRRSPGRPRSATSISTSGQYVMPSP